MSARATIKGTSHADYMPFPFLEEVEVEGASRGGNVVDSLIDFSGPASGDVAFGTQDEWGGVGMAGLVEGGGGDRDGGWMGAGGAQAPLSHGSDGLGDWGRAAVAGRAATEGIAAIRVRLAANKSALRVAS